MKRRRVIQATLATLGTGMLTGCLSEDNVPESGGSNGDGSSNAGGSGAARASYSTSRVKSEAEDIPYDDLLRNIESYTGEEIHSTGEISQSFEEEGVFGFNVAMSRGDGGYWDTTKNAMVIWDGSRYIEDDVVEFWGVIEGMYEYETVMGSTRNIPQITAVDMQLIDETTTDAEASIRITDVDSSWTEYDSQFTEDSGRISTVYATMENTGQLPIEPTLDIEIYQGDSTGRSDVAGADPGATPIYSEEDVQSVALETPPGETQDFTMSPFLEIDTPDEYTIEVTLRESGSSEQLDTDVRVITLV